MLSRSTIAIHALLFGLLTVAAAAAGGSGAGSVLDKGETTFTFGDLSFNLSTSTQVLTSLRNNNQSNGESFEFLPRDLLSKRATSGFYHVGDVDLRWRASGSQDAWNDASSASDRSAVVVQSTTASNVFAAADLTPSLAKGVNVSASNLPFTVQRSWSQGEQQSQSIVMTVNITATSADVEFGGIGFAQVFNNDWTGLSIDETYESCAVADPSISSDAGYVQVNRVNGKGPTLLIAPLNVNDGSLDNGATRAPLVQWRNLKADPTPQSFTNEGHYAWTVATAGYTDEDEAGAQSIGIERGEDWVPPYSLVVRKGQSRVLSLELFTSSGPRATIDRLYEMGKPVAVGVPSMVLKQGATSSVRVRYAKQGAAKVIEVSPSGSMDVESKQEQGGTQILSLKPSQGSFGRGRITLQYPDGVFHSLHTYTINAASDMLAGYGKVMTEDAFYTRTDDYFGRYGIMTYDHVAKKVVLDAQDSWIAGQGDEAGSAYMGVFSKQLVMPDQAEIKQLETFMNTTIYGRLQYREGANASNVRKSLFYYAPNDPSAAPYYQDGIDRGGQWDFKEAHRVDRAYDYPHVTIAWWSLYRLARYHPGATTGTWDFYLDGAFNTVMAMFNKTSDWDASFYTQFGLMEGSVFEAVLDDLQREQWTDKFDGVDEKMRARQARWSTEANPFGSEMPWDSTGQEEVYTWLRRYGDADKAAYTRETVVAIQPLVAHWAYGGTNRRFWDFETSGKLQRFERMGHHYESGLSAIPLLDAFRRSTTSDTHLLQAAYAGLDGALTTIQSDGAPATAFHLYPDAMQWDAWSGDSACGLFGNLFASGSYLVNDQRLGGWQAFGAELTQNGETVTINPTDSARQRIFIAPLALYVTLDAGQVCAVTFDTSSKQVKVTLCRSEDDKLTPNAFLRADNTAGNGSKYEPTQSYSQFLGAYQIALSNTSTVDVTLAPAKI